MKCVEKNLCDFEGFMTDQPLDLTPDLEMLRVPLIPCVNRDRGNSIDVCCRDPNYKDPWPDMNNNNQGGGNNNQPQRGSNNNPQLQQQGRNINNNNNAAGAGPQNAGRNNQNQKPKPTKKRKNGYGK